MPLTIDRRIIFYYDLIRVLVGREMSLLYKRSALGVLWTMINPLLQLLVFLFIFRAILKVEIPHYTSYVFTGLLVWQWFSKATLQATGIIIGNRPLIRQPGFPVSVLPPAVVMTGMIHFALALPILGIFLLLDGILLGPALLWLPVMLLIQFFFTVTMSYLLAGVNVAFRDTQNALGVLLQVMFYMTPIFYSIDRIPADFRTLYELNPMVPILLGYRSILIDGQSPQWTSLLPVVGIIAAVLPLCFLLFRHQSRRFVEEI